jgi:hypothetical protein
MTICPVCGELLERWEIRCTRCVVSKAIPDGGYILIAGQSLPYRLARSITMAAGGALAGAVALAATLGILGLLPLILNGAVLPLVQALVALAGIFAALIGLSGIPVSFGELQKNATFEISKTSIRFNDFHDASGAEAKFIEHEIDLAAVRRVRVDQGRLARLFGYGAIEIFTDHDPNPAAVIPGVSRPHSFKERFELILTHCDISTSQAEGRCCVIEREEG